MLVETLSTIETVLDTCPVYVATMRSGDVDYEYEPCGQSLVVVSTRSVIGDDYGSWAEVSVSFTCGHTLSDMQSSLRHADEV